MCYDVTHYISTSLVKVKVSVVIAPCAIEETHLATSLVYTEVMIVVIMRVGVQHWLAQPGRR